MYLQWNKKFLNKNSNEFRSFISVYILKILLLILPQREINTRNISWLVKVAGAYSWQPYNFHVQIVLKHGSLSFLEPSRFFQACNKIALPLLLILNADMYLSYVLQLIPTSGYSLPMVGSLVQ
jgi:hypothetical protein